MSDTVTHTECQREFLLDPIDNQRLATLCGQWDEHIRQIEQRLQVTISNRGHHFKITGAPQAVEEAVAIVRALYRNSRNTLDGHHVHLAIQEARTGDSQDSPPAIQTPRCVIRGRGPRQCRYLQNISRFDINFGIGPAGTGKTFLAVACAVGALQSDRVKRLVLVRPAVEAGEKLGFLPGDMAQKVDPYLRPLYDALYEMLGLDRVHRLLERNVIEIAPLAFMRGRTLNDAFIILDEAQNTTSAQMKMFLTRIGFGSTAIVTGDMTQVDLPHSTPSGLQHACRILADVDDISITHFTAEDVVRHPLVQKIVNAYQESSSP